jgi:hypothetical protein
MPIVIGAKCTNSLSGLIPSWRRAASLAPGVGRFLGDRLTLDPNVFDPIPVPVAGRRSLDLSRSRHNTGVRCWNRTTGSEELTSRRGRRLRRRPTRGIVAARVGAGASHAADDADCRQQNGTSAECGAHHRQRVYCRSRNSQPRRSQLFQRGFVRYTRLVSMGGTVLFHPSSALEGSPLAQAVVDRGLRLSSSRCGDFHTALDLLAHDAELCQRLEQFVTHRFGARELAHAFEVARSPECIKAVVEHRE